MKIPINTISKSLSITFLILSISTISPAQIDDVAQPSVKVRHASEVIIEKSVPNEELTVNIQQQKIDKCITGTIKYRIADRATANKLCNCTISVRSQMTIGQLWEIESYAQSGIDPNTLPYVIQMQQDLQKCTIGLTLNPPQRP